MRLEPSPHPHTTPIDVGYGSQRKRALGFGLGAAVILLLTFLVFIPAMQGGFIWDDDAYVTENPTIKTLDGLRKIWLEPRSTPQYYPLVFSSFWLEYRLWGLNPAGYHATNVLLHALAALLLWYVLWLLEVPGAWLAALVFALHPVHVESVAWVTERKNVLSGLFYLGSALCLIWFFKLSGNTDIQPRRFWYGLAFFLFICALLSKTVTCTLPAAMVLVLWWKRGRISRREAAALLPLFLLGLLSGLMTAWLERHHVGAVGKEWELSIIERCLVAGRALWFYAGKLAWPEKVMFNYPRWQIDSGEWWQYLYPTAVLLAVLLLWISRRTIGRGPLVGVLFFCGTLFPALGFFDVYPFRYSYVADHFQYLASIGLIVLAVAAVARGVIRLPKWPKRGGIAFGVAVLALFGAQTWRQGYVYEDLKTLWARTLEANPASWLAHYNLGVLLAEQGKTRPAMAHYADTLRLKSDHVGAHVNLGIALAAQERLDEAIGHYRQALKIRPTYPDAHNNLGNALARQGEPHEAIIHYSEALRIDPDHAEAHYNLGLVLAGQGKSEEAVSHYSQTIRIKPDHLRANVNLGVLLAEQGRFQEAIERFAAALRTNPEDSTARRNLKLARQLMAKPQP